MDEWIDYVLPTEIYHGKTNTWSEGPMVPRTVSGHCATSYNKSNIIITGGTNFGTSDYGVDAYFFNIETGHWYDLPKMPNEHIWHGCGIVNTPNGPELVVAGNFSFNQLHGQYLRLKAGF